MWHPWAKKEIVGSEREREREVRTVTERETRRPARCVALVSQLGKDGKKRYVPRMSGDGDARFCLAVPGHACTPSPKDHQDKPERKRKKKERAKESYTTASGSHGLQREIETSPGTLHYRGRPLEYVVAVAPERERE